jgi:hypothetical protein
MRREGRTDGFAFLCGQRLLIARPAERPMGRTVRPVLHEDVEAVAAALARQLDARSAAVGISVDRARRRFGLPPFELDVELLVAGGGRAHRDDGWHVLLHDVS